MPELPTCAPILLRPLGVRLIDIGTLPKDEGLEAERIFRDVLELQVLQRQRPATALCGTEQFENENRLYAEAERLEPGVTYTDFLERAGDAIVVDDSDCDPRLPIKKFAVFTNGRTILGTFTLYNVQIERDEAGGITISAMVMPGCNPPPGRTMRETWTGIMRAILENDLTIGDRILDVVEWRFPTRPSHQWRLSPAEAARISPDDSAAAIPTLGLEVADLEDHDLTKDPDGVPTKVRRRLAPPPPVQRP